MSWIFSLYVAFLFFILTPAILVRLPPKGDKYTVAGFHAVVFALILHFTGNMVWNLCRSLEGFQEGNIPPSATSNKALAEQYCTKTLGENGKPTTTSSGMTWHAGKSICAKRRTNDGSPYQSGDWKMIPITTNPITEWKYDNKTPCRATSTNTITCQ
jgi:hypothetical protein